MGQLTRHVNRLRIKNKLDKHQAVKREDLNVTQHPEELNIPIRKLAITSNNSIHLVDVKGVVRCESSNNYTYFHFTNKKKLLTCRTLKVYENLLVEYGFIRVHQCHLVNMHFVASVEKANGLILHLQNGDEVPVSLRKKESVLKFIRTSFIG